MEPGLDLHEWETRWQELEPELADAPAEALPELADFVGTMLDERGFGRDDPVGMAVDEREVVDAYGAAREVADRVERGEDVERGDVDSAVAGLRLVHEFLTTNRAAE